MISRTISYLVAIVVVVLIAYDDWRVRRITRRHRLT